MCSYLKANHPKVYSPLLANTHSFAQVLHALVPHHRSVMISAKGGRGGVQQRRETLGKGRGSTEAAASSEPTLKPKLGESSPLGSYLLELVAWRQISPASLQKISKKAVAEIEEVISFLRPDDDAGDLAKALAPTLHVFSNLGTGGMHESNIGRELVLKIGPPKIPVSSFNVPLVMPGKQTPENFSQKAIWPHTMVHSIYHNAKDTFSKRICPGGDRLEAFWESQKDHPNFPVLCRMLAHRPGWKRLAIPIKVYGDGVPITGVGKSWAKSTNTYTSSSQVGTGKSVEMVYLIWTCISVIINKSPIRARDTKKVFWKKLIHALKALWCGVFLDDDENGDGGS